MRWYVKVDSKGYDPFWGKDPFEKTEYQKIDWEKKRPIAVSPEDEREFFEGKKNTGSKGSQIGNKVDFKV